MRKGTTACPLCGCKRIKAKALRVLGIVRIQCPKCRNTLDITHRDKEVRKFMIALAIGRWEKRCNPDGGDI